jgi:small conductance mechanosensitive channel
MSFPIPWLAQAVQVPTSSPDPTPSPVMTADPPESVEEATGLIWTVVADLWEGFVANIPFLLVAGVLLAVGFVLARVIGRASKQGITRAGGDIVVSNLTERLVRIVIMLLFVLLALSVAGVSVSAALAGLGIAGLAVALAMQGILENFVAGLIVIIQKPFRAGDEIVIDTYQGLVTDIDLRTTRLRTYDGEMVIIPNTHVFTEKVVNLTHSGVIRTQVAFGIDYRDDHDAVAAIVAQAVSGLDGVLDDPAVNVRCVGLGESSVDFQVRYWSAASRSSVVGTRDRVTRATKTALEANGYTIPWPIRTLAIDDLGDNVVRHRAVGTE